MAGTSVEASWSHLPTVLPSGFAQRFTPRPLTSCSQSCGPQDLWVPDPHRLSQITDTILIYFFPSLRSFQPQKQNSAKFFLLLTVAVPSALSCSKSDSNSSVSPLQNNSREKHSEKGHRTMEEAFVRADVNERRVIKILGEMKCNNSMIIRTSQK